MPKRIPSLPLGTQFGRLTILEDVTEKGKKVYRCRCTCGTEKVVSDSALKQGYVRSCGCLSREVHIPHGHAGRKPSRTYHSWKAMQGRCRYPGVRSYELYGGRGITVCERWRSFENFLADMGERPEGVTLDRIDPDGNYEPDNCRWATPKEQAANRRNKSSDAILHTAC